MICFGSYYHFSGKDVEYISLTNVGGEYPYNLMVFLVENDKANMAELDKLRRENFGLKTTVKNQREKLDKFYRTY